MTIGDIAIKARNLVNKDSNSYTNANLLIDINIWYQKAAMIIIGAEDEADFDDGRNTTTFPMKTTLLVANQRDYSIPVSEKMLKLKRCDVLWDGTNAYRASPIDSGEFIEGRGTGSDSTAETTLDAKFSKTSPRYDIAYNSVFLYPRPNATDVANGGKIRFEWVRQVTEFTSSDLTTGTVVPGFDDPFHHLLAYGPAFEFAQSKGLPQTESLKREIAEITELMKKHYGWKQQDRDYQVNAGIVNYS